MSFSSETKEELSRLKLDKQACLKAELAAFIKASGVLQLSKGSQGETVTTLILGTDYAVVARRIVAMLKLLFQIPAEVEIKRSKGLRSRNHYFIKTLPEADVTEVLYSLSILNARGNLPLTTPQQLLTTKACRRAYLRGWFLASGSVNSPHQSYHLEVTVPDVTLAQALKTIMESLGLKPSLGFRKGVSLLYFKEAEQIAKFLTLIGAHQSRLAFENIRVYKELKNQVNRLVNAETANLNKSIEAGLRQISDIKLIQTRLGLDKLPASLREVAEARLEHPEASLAELGKLLRRPLGKSGINHRLRRLSQIACKLKEKNKTKNLPQGESE